MVETFTLLDCIFFLLILVLSLSHLTKLESGNGSTTKHENLRLEHTNHCQLNLNDLKDELVDFLMKYV